MAELVEVGFWSQKRSHVSHSSAQSRDTRAVQESDDLRPDAAALVDHAWDAAERSLVTAYVLRGGMIESWELGPSWCRFGCAASTRTPHIMGCATLTDGRYCWPEGLHHYLTDHDIRPPQDFINHIVGMARAAGAFSAFGGGPSHSGIVSSQWPPCRRHLLYDTALRRSVPLPKATAEYLYNAIRSTSAHAGHCTASVVLCCSEATWA